ncbi:DUF2163 domain-containing protein [Devosia sp. YIM 151766]|uniref:DUF2163 domain-containing protein n=1 Tax=Devosia sp. YIM 151766 TaxID=3017325 RepID=UPI00255C9AA4|nr:DUF2163 domain-containing protein [Devosia sp. YIM 151766]WIY52464.1 DUF2163 domain-containing protein [Devosia sp. YIM 151766]
MKAISSGLQAHLDSGATTLAWCWRITRSDGVVHGFTDHDRVLAFLGTDFEPDSGFIASEIRTGSDLAVDAQDAEGVLSSDRITETDILDGRWDNAVVEVWRVNWRNVSQRVLMRQGNIGQVRRGRSIFVAEMRSLAHVLNQTVGRVYQASCDADLGDSRCKINLESSAYRGTGAVAAFSGGRAFTASGLGSFASELFSLGTIQWTSGANNGRRADAASHSVSGGVVSVALLEEPVRGIEAGDTFLIRAGCDKALGTCRTKFSNVVNFRGFPTIPGHDAILRYATKDGGHSGGVL